MVIDRCPDRSVFRESEEVSEKQDLDLSCFLSVREEHRMTPPSSTPPRAISKDVRLRLRVQKIAQLIRGGHLCATDFSCLDCRSRDTLKRIFLQVSLKETSDRCEVVKKPGVACATRTEIT